ncbi:MAG: type II secretion system protein J [Chthoniobacteraceae bacterium]
MKSLRLDLYSTAHKRGFSLLEVMVAVAVLTVIGLMVVQITEATSRTTRLSNRTIDAASQARQVFDRIGTDLAALPRRRDMDFYAGNGGSTSGYYSVYNTSNILLFLSRVSSAGATSASRKVSLVSYRVAAHPDNKDSTGAPRLCLIRAGIPVDWTPGWGTGTGFMGLKSDGFPVRLSDAAFPSALLPLAPSTSNANSFDVMAPGVIKMVVGFQLYPDNEVVTLAGSPTSFGNAQGQIVYNAPVRTVTGLDGTTTAEYIDLDRVCGIVVGLVIVDAASLKLLSAHHISTLAGKFSPPADTDNLLPVQAWASTADGLPNLLLGQAPLPALQSVRVFQRYYPVTPFPSKPQ